MKFTQSNTCFQCPNSLISHIKICHCTRWQFTVLVECKIGLSLHSSLQVLTQNCTGYRILQANSVFFLGKVSNNCFFSFGWIYFLYSILSTLKCRTSSIYLDQKNVSLRSQTEKGRTFLIFALDIKNIQWIPKIIQSLYFCSLLLMLLKCISATLTLFIFICN